MVGKLYLHTDTSRLYEVVALIWDGVADTWAVLHKDVDDNNPVMFTRSLRNFTGRARDGNTYRFIEVKNRPRNTYD